MAQSLFRYFHSPQFALYDFGNDHAFNPIRQQLTYDLALSAQLFKEIEVVEPRPIEDDTLALFHSREYIEAVKEVGQSADKTSSFLSRPDLGLGTADNPIFPHMHEATALRVSATLEASQGVMRGDFEHAANLGGGLHHALVSKASGFCIYNDIGVAIAWLRKHLDCRVAYVDLDAHHGDGVQWGFYDDPDVLTISIHESGLHLFPGTGGVDEIGEGPGRGSSVNIPLLPYTTSQSWLACFERVVPDIIDAFKPDILITQHGCDPHRLDPLTHLSVSVEAMDKATQLLHQLAHDYCAGRWVALGGGGYAIWEVVPRAWALLWARLTEREISDHLPREWLDRWEPRAPVSLPTHWYDVVDESSASEAQAFESSQAQKENEKNAEYARQTALAYLRKRRRPL